MRRPDVPTAPVQSGERESEEAFLTFGEFDVFRKQQVRHGGTAGNDVVLPVEACRERRTHSSVVIALC